METNLNYPSYPKGFLETIYHVHTLRQIERSIAYLRRVLQGVHNVVGTVSGKDSIVAVDLFVQVYGRKIPIIINRYVGHRKLPDRVIDELYSIASALAEDVIITEFQWGGHSNLFVQIVRYYDYDAIVTGLRRQEDGEWPDEILVNNRRVAIIAPLRRWRHSDVWAYIAKYRLPVPSAYRDALPWESLQLRVLT
jgi:3'-phosphoadenosine 5'-phosphosulfate sulfotransferase (PAPS reductase)/FAD synthetase